MKPLDTSYWYHSISGSLLFPFITKISKNIQVWRHSDNHCPAQNSRFSVKYRWKLKILPKKVLNIGISLGFLLIKKGNSDFNILCKFQLHSVQISFKWRLKISSGGNHTPPPPSRHIWWLTLPYLKGVPPFFFLQNDRKGCRLDYLDGFGHFLFGFGAAWKKNLEGITTPLAKTRDKMLRANGPIAELENAHFPLYLDPIGLRMVRVRPN